MYILLKYLCRCCGYIDSEYEFKSYKLCCILLEYFKVGSLKSESEFIRYSMAQVYNVFLVNTFCIISRYLTQLFRAISISKVALLILCRMFILSEKKPVDKSCCPMAPIDLIELLIQFLKLCNDS